jgi:hypothetical protein
MSYVGTVWMLRLAESNCFKTPNPLKVHLMNSRFSSHLGRRLAVLVVLIFNVGCGTQENSPTTSPTPTSEDGIPVASFMERIDDHDRKHLLEWFTAEKPMDEIYRWFDAELPKAGWQRISDAEDHPFTRTLRFQKGDRKCKIVISGFMTGGTMSNPQVDSTFYIEIWPNLK